MTISKRINIKNRIFKGLVTFALAAIICNSVSITSMAYNGAYPFTIRRAVIADGVRLRKEPNIGTILELMYKKDTFWAHTNYANYPNSYGWVFGKRDSTETEGFVDPHFVGL